MKERRASERYGLQLAISFRRVPEVSETDVVLGETEVLIGETGNISTGGMYFTTAHSLILSEVLNFSLAFPGLAHGADVRVTGRARVVRVAQTHPTAAGQIGVGVITEEYRILEPEAAA